ncbi:MAG: hypothetical protein QOE61_5130 [Micromonosporaceae bacterium]|jgi:hypothetical protein|nr:hypothetical protein [Micromonosporaceae bacterium]
MTYGYWLDQATTHLRDAAFRLAGGPAPTGLQAVLAIHTTRRHLYLALARHVELLTDEPFTVRPAVGRRAAREPLPTPTGTFLAALREAAGPANALPPASPTSPAGLALHQATDALAVAADILASHIDPRRRPRTPEGAAIRAGGGVAAGLGDLAQATVHAIAVDMTLPDWIATTDPRHQQTIWPLAHAVRQTITGPLPTTVRDLVAAGQGQKPLLRLLDTAPPTGQPAAVIRTVDDAGATLRQARIWMWQNPHQIHAVHLRAATQLGLASTILAGRSPADHTSTAAAWRRAANVTAELRGSPPAGDAAHVADSLIDVLRWARNQLSEEDVPPAAIEQVTGQLSAMAEALFEGVASAVKRGELFLNDKELSRPARRLVAYATPVWRHARMGDARIGELRHALRATIRAASNSSTTEGASPARTAFVHPPRPGSAQAAPTSQAAALAGSPAEVARPRGR